MITHLTIAELKEMFADDLGAVNSTAIFKRLGTWLHTLELGGGRWILISDGIAWCVVFQPFDLSQETERDWDTWIESFADWDVLEARVKELFYVPWRASLDEAIMDFTKHIIEAKPLDPAILKFLIELLEHKFKAQS